MLQIVFDPCQSCATLPLEPWMWLVVMPDGTKWVLSLVPLSCPPEKPER